MWQSLHVNLHVMQCPVSLGLASLGVRPQTLSLHSFMCFNLAPPYAGLEVLQVGNNMLEELSGKRVFVHLMWLLRLFDPCYA